MSKLIVDCTSGEIVERELSKAEKDQQKIDESAQATQQAEAEAKATAKAALLSKLGITAEEAALLLS
jgi:hypothetical protein